MDQAEIERIIVRNRFIESFNFFALLILVVVLSLVFIVNHFLYQIVAMGIFFCGMGLLVVFGPEMTSIKFSDVLAYYLERLSSKIRHHTKEQSIAKEGLITIKTANRLIDEYIQEGKSKPYLVFGFDKSEHVLKRLQGSLKKAYTFFEEFDEHEEHKDDLERNFSKIGKILKEERDFLKKEESLLDELEKLPIMEKELMDDKFVFLRLALSKRFPLRLILFSAVFLCVIWVVIPYFQPLDPQNQVLVSLTIIGTATITQVFRIEKK